VILLRIINQKGEIMKENIFVITGGPSVGKTALLKSLRDRGHICFDEVARAFIEEQLSVGGKIVPWIDLPLFNKHVLDRQIQQHLDAGKELHFFDRGIPDDLGYLKLGNIPISQEFQRAADEYRYNKIVFFLEPWREIYVNDAARKEPFEVALKLSDCLKQAYISCGYELVVVPKVSVRERTDFVLNEVKKLNL
jgi:predicted ATPase